MSMSLASWNLNFSQGLLVRLGLAPQGFTLLTGCCVLYKVNPVCVKLKWGLSIYSFSYVKGWSQMRVFSFHVSLRWGVGSPDGDLPRFGPSLLSGVYMGGWCLLFSALLAHLIECFARGPLMRCGFGET